MSCRRFAPRHPATCLRLLLLVGPAFGQEELVVRDNIGKSWIEEPIVWSMSFAPGRLADGPILLRRDGQPIPSQLVVKERHPDGTIRSADALFIIDRLEKEANKQPDVPL